MRIRKTIMRNYRSVTRTVISGDFSVGLGHEYDGSVSMIIHLGKKGRARYEIIFQEREALKVLNNCIWHLQTTREEVEKLIKKRK